MEFSWLDPWVMLAAGAATLIVATLFIMALLAVCYGAMCAFMDFIHGP